MYKKLLCFVGTLLVVSVTLVTTLPVSGIAAGPQSSNVPAPPILDNIPPAWSQKLPAAKRFELVLDNYGVLDKETGLVWQKRPSNRTFNWVNGLAQCSVTNLGGRAGWHLPTVTQLGSLIDKSVDTSPKLPEGHPFMNVKTEGEGYEYLTASTHPQDPSCCVWSVDFATGDLWGMPRDQERYIWCVRGGQTYDAY